MPVDIVVWIVLGLAGATLLMALWPYISDFFSRAIIPTLRARVSGALADALSGVIQFIDSPANGARAVVLKTYEMFRKNVLGIRTCYQQKTPSQVDATTELYVLDNGRYLKHSMKKIERWEDLPDEVRNRLRGNSGVVGVDMGKTLDEFFRKKAQQAGIALSQTT